jgi:hypothetical protein
VDATSVADLVARSYPDVKVVVGKDLNAISVLGNSAEQQRIAVAINDLDAAQGSGQTSGGADYGDGNIAVVNLPYAIPSKMAARRPQRRTSRMRYNRR